MEVILLFSSILFLIVVINHVNKLENTTVFKRATPEEQKKMIEQRDKEEQEKRDRAAQRGYEKPYDYGDSPSPTYKSNSSSSYSDSYTNPSTGLPMASSGTGGVDTSGTPYGM